MYPTKLISLLAPVVLIATTVHAGFTAWSGDACNGAVGLDVPCNGGCGSFDTRHSFLVRYSMHVVLPEY